MYQKQDGCSVTTGGPDYNIVAGADEYLVGKRDSDEIKLFKNGTTPVLTFFYNEPWNNATTGPAPFLGQPEVHLTCLRTLPSAKQESGARKLQDVLGSSTMATLMMCSLLWMSLVL